MKDSWKKRCRAIAAAVWILGGASSIVYAEQAFMPLSEVQEGMKGVARTVVHGTDIDSFDVDVLGVMKDKGASGGDLVLVRVSGPLIDQTGGIAQGMSGSPVYIDGKLLGAISYGFPNSDGRLGMVTPISDMIRLWTVDQTKGKSSIPKPSPDLIPIETPLMAVGYTQDALSYMSGKMKDFHMTPYAAAAVGSDETARPLEAGGAVAAALVTGDLKLGAIGTVTYVDGNHMVAFGHPFMSRGNTDYFMSNSYIFTVVPSRTIPFKLGSMGAEIGVVNQDRGAGIGGVSGVTASSVALHAAVTDEDRKETRETDVRMIDDESLLPTLTATTAYDGISKTMDRTGQGTVRLSYTLWPKDLKQKPFTRKNMYWSSKDVAERSVDELYNVVKLLEQNRFEDYTLRSITVDMNVTEERKTAQLLDATASPMVVSPGDTIYIKARLQPFRGEIFYKDLTFTVPKDQPYGDMILEVRGGGVIPLPYLIQQQQYNLTDEIIGRLRTYKDFNDLHSTLMDEDQNNQVVAEILDPNVSMIAKDGEEAGEVKIQNHEPAPSPEYLKKDKPKKEETGEKEKAPKSRVETDYVVYGDGQFTFRVTSPEKRDVLLREMQKARDKENKITVTMKNQEKDLLSGGDKKEEDSAKKDAAQS